MLRPASFLLVAGLLATGGVASAAVSSGGPVPPGTRATSVTFISPDSAFVLGTAPCAHRPCSAILRTFDRGRSWQGLPAPREAVGPYAVRGLWGLRFADAQHGFAFGKGLWETSNGGHSWHRANAPGRMVLVLEAVRDRELVAVVASHQGLRLYRRPVSSGGWTLARTTRTDSTVASIAVHGSDVRVVMGTRYYVSRDGAMSFHRRRVPCAAGDATAVADDGVHTYLLCSGQGAAGSVAKPVFRRSDHGSSWRRAGRPPRLGDPQGITAGSDTAVVVAAASGASWLYRSTDGGHSWQTVLTKNDGGVGWADLGFTTSRDGVVIHGPAIRDGGGGGRPGRLLLTEDGGRTWHRVRF